MVRQAAPVFWFILILKIDNKERNLFKLDSFYEIRQFHSLAFCYCRTIISPTISKIHEPIAFNG